MNKVLNKILYILKNILLPILMIVTIYIVALMFQRLKKELFGANFTEFISVIFPFFLLIILCLTNFIFEQNNVRNSLFYNVTSFFVMLTITYFCYRALFDKNMYFWYKYGYDINFNYFSDQIAPMKIMLYVLSFANIILMIEGYVKGNNNESKKKTKVNDKKGKVTE